MKTRRIGDKMSKKDQALKDWEETKQREKYWQNLFVKMRESEKEGNKVVS